MPQYVNSPSTYPAKPVSSGAALASGLILKAAPGNLLALSVTATTVAGWAMVFDAAAVPADGAVAPAYSWPVFAGGFASFGFGNAARFAVGIAVAFSSTGPLTLTKSATAFISGQVQ